MKVLAPTIFLSVLAASQVQGVPLYQSKVPNGNNVSGVDALGHEDPTGYSDIRNVFGIAFEEAGMEWTQQLCEADSDEDGQTNGQELGDPCCIWIEGSKPLRTAKLSHPGDKSKTSDKSIWASLNCDAIRAQASASREAAKESSEKYDTEDPEDIEDGETKISTGTGTSTAPSFQHVSSTSTIAATVASVMALFVL